MTRAESRRHTREKILASAQELFSTQGYRGTSLDQIAETAGFSKGAVYSNWGSKEALFLDLLDAASTQQNPEAGIDLTPTPWALATLEFFLEAINNEETRAALAARYEQARTGLAAQLSRGGEEPEWGSWEELASVVMALGSGLIIQSAIDPKAVDTTLVNRIVHQLTPPAAS